MRKHLSIVLMAVFAIPTLAYADTFTFTATGMGGGFSGSGSFVATNNGNGSDTITAISGTGILGLIAPNGLNGNDNLLFPGGTSQVDSKGFAFTDIMGNTAFMVDISSTAGGYQAYFVDSDNFSTTIPVTFTLANSTVTPEPSSLVLLGTGLLGVVDAARRKYLKSQGRRATVLSVD